MSKDYYAILKIARTASDADVKKAHRKLVFELHPDRNKSKDAEKSFKLVQEAYEALSNVDKRRAYDSAYSPPSSKEQTKKQPAKEVWKYEGKTANKSAPVRGIIEVLKVRNKSRFVGEDFHGTKTIDFVTAIFGKDNVEVSYECAVPCETCKGNCSADSKLCAGCEGTGRRVSLNWHTGNYDHVNCSDCSGYGFLLVDVCQSCKHKGSKVGKKKSKFNFPSDIKDGERLYWSKAGGAGRLGGDCGDVYVTFTVENHPHFTRSKRALGLEARIRVSVFDYLCRKTISIKYLDDNGVLKDHHFKVKPYHFFLTEEVVVRGGIPSRVIKGCRGHLYCLVIVDFRKNFKVGLKNWFNHLLGKG